MGGKSLVELGTNSYHEMITLTKSNASKDVKKIYMPNEDQLAVYVREQQAKDTKETVIARQAARVQELLEEYSGQPVIALMNKDDFDDIIKSDTLVIVDFWATWCGPCIVFKPQLEAFAKEDMKRESYIVCSCEADENKETIAALGVGMFPTFHFYKAG